jgi:hypothetical protein
MHGEVLEGQETEGAMVRAARTGYKTVVKWIYYIDFDVVWIVII